MVRVMVKLRYVTRSRVILILAIYQSFYLQLSLVGK